MILVHGITTSSFIWEPVADLLTPRFDVVAVDLLGFGESDRDLSADYSVPAHAERVAGLIRALGLGPVHLVAHDVGGAIAQILAVRHPELFDGLALLNSVGYDYWPVPPISTLRAPILRQLAFAALQPALLRLVVRRGLYHPERATPSLFASFYREVSAPDQRKSFLRFVRALDNRVLLEIAPALRRLELPTLIVRGAADVYLDRRIAVRLHEEIPGSEYVVIDTAGHFLQLDEPAALAALLTEFFTSHVR
jgi:pimeloyl-ACP methyl ester carboxylesterase